VSQSRWRYVDEPYEDAQAVGESMRPPWYVRADGEGRSTGDARTVEAAAFKHGDCHFSDHDHFTV